jgi:hypothetical protein
MARDVDMVIAPEPLPAFVATMRKQGVAGV